MTEFRSKTDIRKFIEENFLFGAKIPIEKLTNDVSFLDEGIIDSTGILEIVSWIEETYEFEIEDHELTPENFDTVNNLYAYIKIKLTEKELKERPPPDMTPWKQTG